jgi:hypothetical protein
MRGGRVMRPRCHLFAIALAAAILPLSASGDLGPCQDPNDPCALELLQTFEPILEFENNGPGGYRHEYPVHFLADDERSENNAETDALGGSPWNFPVYVKAIPMTDQNGTAYWLLEYHYYFHRNWQEDVPGSNKYTHEHDWEWVYVLVGWYEPMQRYVGYAAVLSSHDKNNRDAMDDNGTYLFPQVVLKANTNYEYVDKNRRLSKDWISPADTTTMLTRAGVKVLAKGNEMSAQVTVPQHLSTGYYIVPEILSWLAWSDSVACVQGWTDRVMCFGDPGNCEIPRLCSRRGECKDCDAKRWVPWMRDGLGTNNPIPTDFDFPDTLVIQRKKESATWVPLEVHATEAGWSLRWPWPSEPPAHFELLASDPSTGWRCWLGRIPGEEGHHGYHVQLQPSRDDHQIRRHGGVWIVSSPCLLSPESSSIEIELWVETSPGGERQPVGRARLTGDPPSRERILLRVDPNPTTATCRIRLFLPEAGPTRVLLYDVRGRRIRVLADSALPAGWHTLTWDRGRIGGAPVSSGIYFAAVETPSGREVARIVVLR